MSRFSYSAITNKGQRVSGMLRGRDRLDVLTKLRGLGYHPVSLQTADVDKASANFGHFPFRRITTSQLAVTTRQFASLLKAGLPMLQALATLREQSSNPRLTRILQDLEETIQRDASNLSDALEMHPQDFDAVYCGLVRSGEEGGNLVNVLQDLAAHLTRTAKLRGQVLGAFIYPVFLLLMGTAAVFVLMTFVVPKFKELFESFDQQLPKPTVALMAISGFLATWWWLVLALLAVGTFLAVLGLSRSGIRERVDRILLRLPALGPMFLKLEMVRISRMLAALLSSGVHMVEALRITRQTVRNLAVKSSFAAIIRQVTHGQALADAFANTGLFPPMIVNLVRTGEATAELSEMLEESASIYEEEADRAVSSAVKLLEPILIVIMGGMIAGIVAAVMLPIFQSSTIID